MVGRLRGITSLRMMYEVDKFVDSFDVPRSFNLRFAVSRSHWVTPLSNDWAIALGPGDMGEAVEARPAWMKAVDKASSPARPR